MPRSRTRGWGRLLARPVPVRNGTTLRTLLEAGSIVLAVPPGKQMHPAWQCAADELMRAADTGAAIDVEAATEQVELALFLDGRLRME